MNTAERLKASAGELTDWFVREKTDYPWRSDRNPYHVWISEIMLQQTRTTAVIEYYKRFIAIFPSLKSLAEAEEERVLKAWEGLGYYSRARNLHRCAKMIMHERGGRFPEEEAELKKLPGIGEYTAGAIASLAFNRPSPAVDGNILRILARFNQDERNVLLPEVKIMARETLSECLKQLENPGLFNEALMELGERICLPSGKPRCRFCPLKEACLALKAGLREDLPLRGKPGERRIEKKTVLLLTCGGKTALIRRPDKGLLAGLYAFPLLEGHVILNDLNPWLASFDLPYERPKALPEASHVFSHVEWQMRGWHIETREELPGFLYARREEIREKYAIPAAFRTYRDILFKDHES